MFYIILDSILDILYNKKKTASLILLFTYIFI